MVLPWDLGNHESYNGNLVGGMLVCWEQAVHISKKETYLTCWKAHVKHGTSGTCSRSDGQDLEISQHFCFYASISLLFQIRVIYSEVGLEAPSSASLPRKPAKKTGTKHRKSRSMESFDSIMNNSGEYEEDNFSDTDNEEEWQKEAQQSNHKDWQKESHQSNANEWQNESQQSTYV